MLLDAFGGMTVGIPPTSFANFWDKIIQGIVFTARHFVSVPKFHCSLPDNRSSLALDIHFQLG